MRGADAYEKDILWETSHIVNIACGSVTKVGNQVQDDNFINIKAHSPFTIHHSLVKSKCAFTLAEVLITLGIIGVVAALTLPTIINNYQKKVTVEQLKTTYSLLMNVFERVKSDYGSDSNLWQGSSYNINDFDFLYSTYFKPYIQTFDKQNGKICVHYKCKTEYKNLKGQSMYQHDWAGSFRLKNGAFIHIHPYHCGTGMYSDMVYIDINGPEHGPNVLGKDVFDYMLTIGRDNVRKNGILTTPCEAYSREELKNRCNKDYDGNMCVAPASFSCCASLIMHDGWEIKDDYPW